MILPSGKVVYVSTPIYAGSHFTWGEATCSCTRQIENLVLNNRIAINAIAIEKNIIKTAIALDEIRDQFNNRPLKVNSWYRPALVNHSVGGARNSRHQYGDAVDIHSDYYTPQKIFTLITPIHPDGGLGLYPSFVHIDWRGYKARW